MLYLDFLRRENRNFFVHLDFKRYICIRIDTIMDELKDLLREELGFLPEGPGLDSLLNRGEWLHLPSKSIIIEAGKKNPDIYILRDGIIRLSDMDGDKERTFAFALPGTIIQSKHSFVMHLPSYYQMETCCPSTVLHISEKDFWESVNSDHKLAIYMLHYAYGELFYQEYKFCNIHNGTAKERFLAIYKDRPAIIEKVPQRVIASYLGITPEYYSQLKREITRKR